MRTTLKDLADKLKESNKIDFEVIAKSLLQKID